MNPDRLDLDAMRTALVARLADLESASAESTAERQPVQLDQTSVGRLSRIDAMQIQAMAAAAERRRLADIQRVKAALDRLGTGEYGFCVSCGEEIARKRMAADPAIATCIGCAARGSR